jgi:hypothetical protein
MNRGGGLTGGWYETISEQSGFARASLQTSTVRLGWMVSMTKGLVRGDILDGEEDCSGIFLREWGLYEEVSASSSSVCKGIHTNHNPNLSSNPSSASTLPDHSAHSHYPNYYPPTRAARSSSMRPVPAESESVRSKP